jgi:DNA primase
MSDIEEIKSRLNIIDVLGGYIRLEKAGANHRALCPFHNEKSPSFMINEDKQIWHCFGCQKGGDIFAFVMEIEGLDFKEALNMLAERAGVELRKVDPKMAKEKNQVLEILELATKFYETQLWKGAGKISIMSYLKERGLSEESIQNFRLGYAPNGWRNLLDFLVGRGYLARDIEKAGLIIKKNESNQYYDRFRERIMFPIADSNGKILGYSARVAPGGDETQAKYVNTPETEVYHKSKVLYGMDKAKQEIRKQDFVLLVEGNMDVIAAYQTGIKNTVAVSGTALTLEQINLIKRYTRNIKMFFDMDSAGEAATKKSIKLCFEEGLSVQVVELPEGKDAADMARKNPEELRIVVEKARGAMEYFFAKVLSKYDRKNVEHKKIIATELLEMISNITSPIEKSHWVKELSQEINTEESILTGMLKQANIKDRVVKKTFDSQSNNAFAPTDKIGVIVENLIGLMLVSDNIWKMVKEKEVIETLFLKDSLLNLLIKIGDECQFSFDELLKRPIEKQLKDRIEKIYFEKKYRIGLNNEPEEVVIADPMAEAEKCLLELKREANKKELEKVIDDLRMAEKSGDKEAMQLLRVQSKKILEELNKLANQ